MVVNVRGVRLLNRQGKKRWVQKKKRRKGGRQGKKTDLHDYRSRKKVGKWGGEMA